jgi:outer membrane protein assembly factor BamD
VTRSTQQRVFTVLAVVVLAALLGSCGGKPVLTNLTARELWEQGRAEYDKGKYYKSIEYFQTVVFNYAGSSLVDSAQYYLAMSYFGNEEWELARVEFTRLVTNYPSSDYATASQFMRAVCAYKAAPEDSHKDQKELAASISELEDFIIDYPESQFVSDAQALIREARGRLARKYFDAAVVYMRIRALNAAKIYFQKVVDDYTETDFGPLAAFGKAEAEYEQQNFLEAKGQFSRFASVFPDHIKAGPAREMEAESAFKAAEKAYDKGDYVAARERLEEFLAEFPNHDKSAKARELLDNLPAATADSSVVSHAQDES